MSETLKKNITVSVRTPENKFSVELPAGSSVQDIINLIGFMIDKDVQPSNSTTHGQVPVAY
jgi:hypothetical protein